MFFICTINTLMFNVIVVVVYDNINIIVSLGKVSHAYMVRI